MTNKIINGVDGEEAAVGILHAKILEVFEENNTIYWDISIKNQE